jgi:hypothetical protein
MKAKGTEFVYDEKDVLLYSSYYVYGAGYQQGV